MAKSVTQERREIFYPDPMYKNLLEALSEDSGEPKSSIVNRALRELLDKMPSVQNQSLLQKYKK